MLKKDELIAFSQTLNIINVLQHTLETLGDCVNRFVERIRLGSWKIGLEKEVKKKKM